MTEVIVRFQTDQTEVDVDFYGHLELLAQQYGLRVENKVYQQVEDEDQHKRRVKTFFQKANLLAKELGPVPSDSADDIRQIRDNR